MKLIYVGDPMCSWCYGFGKELSALAERVPEIPVEIVVGGLRAGATDVLDEDGKQFRLHHWARVEAASQLPFNREALMARKGFVYDTEPICRAVVAARRLVGDKGLVNIFRALQRGFYVAGMDTTDARVLSQLAVDALAENGTPIEFDKFLETFNHSDTIQEARRDFQRARALGVTSFPALLLEHDKQTYVVSPGYASAAELEQRLNLVKSRLN